MTDEKTTAKSARSGDYEPTGTPPGEGGVTDAKGRPLRSAAEVQAENQEKGYQGVDSAEQAGGIDKLREQTRERLERDGDNTGSTPPATSPGHPSDPTVSATTSAGS